MQIKIFTKYTCMQLKLATYKMDSHFYYLDARCPVGRKRSKYKNGNINVERVQIVPYERLTVGD
jgi:hypothetical protein